MYYVDSNVLISYVFLTGEPYHATSQRFLEDLVQRRQKLYTSSLTLVETYNVICRKIVKEGSKLIDPLQVYVDIYRDAKDKCRFLVSLIISFLREKLGIEFIDDEKLYEFVTVSMGGMELPRIFKEAIELSYKINLRVKDLLHLIYAHKFSNTHGIKFFLTHDIEDFEKIVDEVKQLLQIEIILVK